MEGGSQTIQPAIAAAAPRSTVATRIRTWWLTWQRSCVIGVAGAACLALLTELIGLVAAFGGRFPVELQQHPESAVGGWRQRDANLGARLYVGVCGGLIEVHKSLRT